MKIATWNVNGIRAREGQVHEWIARERPDVVCLQEIKAARPDPLLRSSRSRATGATGTAARGTPASGCMSAGSSPRRPPFAHPPFDFESRIVTVDLTSDRRRHRRVDLRAERRQGLPREDAFPRGDGCLRRRGAGGRPAARPVRRLERRAHRPGRPSEGTQAARHRPAAGGARAARADHRQGTRGRRPRARPRQRRALHLVGAVAEPAEAQHRLAPRLRARSTALAERAPRLPGAEGRRHERSRAGGGHVR